MYWCDLKWRVYAPSILQILIPNSNPKTHGGAGTALEVLVDVVPRLDDYKDHVDLNFDCEVRILVHQSQVGSIIGRAGSKIKELRDVTGTNIRVYSQCCPMSTDRVIQITGLFLSSVQRVVTSGSDDFLLIRSG